MPDAPGGDPLAAGFRIPPDSAKPRTWWHWTMSNVTKEGITKDREWMKRVGIGGFMLADVNAGGSQTVENKIHFGTPEWFDAVRHAAAGAGIASAQVQRPLDVLLVTGGHGFEREPFLQMFRDNADIAFTHAEHAQTGATAYDRDDLFAYNVVVLYDMPKSITEAQKARLLAFLGRGKGLVVLHHALVSYQDWPEYERIIGGRYPEPDPARPGLVTERVGYEHDVEIPIVVAARDHPVTAGINGFTIRDEIYWGFRVGRDVTPVLTTPHPKSGWCRATAKRSRRRRARQRGTVAAYGQGPGCRMGKDVRQREGVLFDVRAHQGSVGKPGCPQDVHGSGQVGHGVE